MWNVAFREPGRQNPVPSFFDRGDVWPTTTAVHDIGVPGFSGTSGVVTGTRIATEYGWKAAEDLRSGDMVLTFDEGLVQLAEIHVRSLGSSNPQGACSASVLDVPSRAIGNRAPMQLMPGQLIVLESDLAEALFGDPFVLLHAGSLCGYRGIASIAAPGLDRVVTMIFDRPQAVHAEGSALLHAPGRAGARDIVQTVPGGFALLGPARERQFAIWLRRGENGVTPPFTAACPHPHAALSVPTLLS